MRSDAAKPKACRWQQGAVGLSPGRSDAAADLRAAAGQKAPELRVAAERPVLPRPAAVLPRALERAQRVERAELRPWLQEQPLPAAPAAVCPPLSRPAAAPARRSRSS